MTITRADVVQAALYQRVSTTDQEAERQNDENRDVAAREGWAATEYEDKISASRFGTKVRPDWQRLLTEIEAGHVDVLVLWESSRGGRELEGWAALLSACRRHGTLIHITLHRRTYDVRVAREWRTLAEDGVDSAYESEKMADRIRAGKAAGVRAGRPQGSIAYGIFRRKDMTQTRRNWIADEPHRETGPTVAEIIRRAGQRESYTAICRDLNARGILSPGGKLWTPLAITTICANPVYASAGVVTQAESTAARARVTEGKFTGKGKGERPGRAKFRYGRVMHCPTCGGLIDGDGSRGRRYACHARNAAHAGTRAANGSAYVEMATADAYIDSRMIDWLCQPRALAVTDSDDAGAQSALDEAGRYEQMISEVMAEAGSGNVDPDELMIKLAAVKGYRVKAQTARKRAETLATPSPLAGLAGDSRDVVAAHWDALSIPMRKAAARIIAPHMTLRPGTGPVCERIICWPEDEH